MIPTYDESLSKLFPFMALVMPLPARHQNNEQDLASTYPQAFKNTLPRSIVASHQIHQEMVYNPQGYSSEGQHRRWWNVHF